MRTPLAILALTAAGHAAAEPPAKSFVGFYAPLPGRDNRAVSAAVDAAGAVYVLGNAAATASSVWSVIKYAPNGAVQWTRTDLPGAASANASRILIDPAGRVFVIGNAVRQPSWVDAAVVRLDPATGNTLWTARWENIPGSQTDVADAAIDGDGDLLVVGSRWTLSEFAPDWITLKLDGDTGALLWSRREDGLGGGPDGIVDAAYSVAVDQEGAAYVAGTLQLGGAEGYELRAPAVVKYDASGERLWRTLLGDADHPGDIFRSFIRVGPDGRPVLFAGRENAALTVKLEAADGAVVWSDLWLGDGDGAQPFAAAIDAAGDPVLVAQASIPSAVNRALAVRKFDRDSGAPRWTSIPALDPSTNSLGASGRSVAVGPDGAIFVAGSVSYFPGPLQSRALALALRGADGAELWHDLVSPAPSRYDAFVAVVADAAGAPTFVGMHAEPAPGASSMLAARYSCLADFNGDGFTDFFDYDAYIACFEGEACPPGRSADFNGDGFADFFDYDDFVAAFETGC